MKKYTLIILALFIFSCNSYKNKRNFTNKVKVVKFMYVADYAIPIYIDDFWEHKEEHATINLFGYNSYLSKRFSEIKKDTLHKFGFINYAFVLTIKGKIDTIYVDSTLKHYMIKNRNNNEYEYFISKDNKIIDETFVEIYTFFSNCW